MCRPNEDCDADKTARTFVGEWMMQLSKRDAHDVAFIQTVMKDRGKRLGSVGDVIVFALRKVAFDLAGDTVVCLTEGEE